MHTYDTHITNRITRLYNADIYSCRPRSVSVLRERANKAVIYASVVCVCVCCECTREIDLYD